MAKTVSLNCGHWRACCSSSGWYTSMESHGGIISTGETELAEKPSQCHHKSNMAWTGRETGPPRWEAGDYPLEPWRAVLHLDFIDSCIREVAGSNLSPDTSYPDWGCSWFSSVPPGEYQDSTLELGHDRFLQNPFQFIIHLLPIHSTLYSLTNSKSFVK
jgi:hypothetical protein